MAERSEFGDFLRSRRARVSPENAGIPRHGRRRVRGLRREELAQLAGISVSYYIRLEQGHDGSASDSVLDALARALRLSPAERSHLYSLTRSRRRTRPTAEPERVRDGIELLVDSLDRLPALVLGRYGDVLVWNRLAHALLAGHLPYEAARGGGGRPNWTRMFFLDPRFRALFLDWEEKARDTVADLRMIAGGHPADQRIAEIVGELSRRSTEFAALWSAHAVWRCVSHDRRLRHPVVGELTLADELMTLPDDDGQRLVIFRAVPRTSSAAALTLLAELSTGDTGRATPHPDALVADDVASRGANGRA